MHIAVIPPIPDGHPALPRDRSKSAAAAVTAITATPVQLPEAVRGRPGGGIHFSAASGSFIAGFGAGAAGDAGVMVTGVLSADEAGVTSIGVLTPSQVG